MRILRGTLGHVLVLALVAGFVSGPTGVAGVVHPDDDPACRPGSSAPSAAPTWSATGQPAPHCPTCHLLRGVRCDEVRSPALVFARIVTAAAVPPAASVYHAGPDLSSVGRSPPSIGGASLVA